jgi:hypothetical protein
VSWLEDLVTTRATRPEAIAEAAAARRPADLSGADRLLLVAADHPARAALGTGGSPMAMADRVALIDRLRTVLARPGVHGVLATADILEDLLLLGALDGKLVFGSMNRAGIAGSSFEIDDRFTGCDPQTLAGMGFEGGKMLLRIDPDDPATPRTLEACGRAVTELAAHGRLAMLEPFWSGRVDGRTVNDLSPEAVIRSISVASGLGATSAYTWLKVPVVPDMARVMAASTLPALLLGGDSVTDRSAMVEGWRAALELPTVRGLVVGRNLLYPAGGDVDAAVDAILEIL